MELAECRDWECPNGSFVVGSSRDGASRWDLLVGCIGSRAVHSRNNKTRTVLSVTSVYLITFDGFLDTLLGAKSKSFSSFWSSGLGGITGTAGLGIGVSPVTVNNWSTCTFQTISSYRAQCSPSSIPLVPWKRKLCKLTWRHRLPSNKKPGVNSLATLRVALRVWGEKSRRV